MPRTPILMIPGLNATPRAFAAQMETLWQFGPVTIADNQTGSSVAEMAAAILDDAPARFILGGFSMGGYVALEIMRRAPDRVLKLMLIDTQAAPDTPEATANRRRGIDLARAGKLELAAAGTFPNTVHPGHVDDPELQRIHLDMARANGAEAYIRQQELIIARPDSRPGLSGIAVPTLIVVGAADQITPVAAAQEMADAIPGSQLVIIEGAGHMAVIEQPERVNSAIASFLTNRSAQFGSN